MVTVPVYLQVRYLSVCRCVYRATALSRGTWVQACRVCEHLCPSRCSNRESRLLTRTRTSSAGASLPAPLAGASLKKKEKNTHIIHDKYCNRSIWEHEGSISKPERNKLFNLNYNSLRSRASQRSCRVSVSAHGKRCDSTNQPVHIQSRAAHQNIAHSS